MRIKQSELEEKKLARRKKGKIYCPDCDRELRFNSGDPAVFHTSECSRYPENPTYLKKEKIMSNLSNKDNILRALRQSNVESVTVCYCGSGDSGSIEDVIIEPHIHTKVPYRSKTSRFENGEWVKEMVTEKKELEDAIKELCYDFLEKAHPGWEINDGSQGEFIFDIETGEIRLVHCNFYTESDYSEHSF